MKTSGNNGESVQRQRIYCQQVQQHGLGSCLRLACLQLHAAVIMLPALQHGQARNPALSNGWLSRTCSAVRGKPSITRPAPSLLCMGGEAARKALLMQYMNASVCRTCRLQDSGCTAMRPLHACPARSTQRHASHAAAPVAPVACGAQQRHSGAHLGSATRAAYYSTRAASSSCPTPNKPKTEHPCQRTSGLSTTSSTCMPESSQHPCPCIP